MWRFYEGLWKIYIFSISLDFLASYRYYLYKRTSKRVPGKKYPQPVDTYIGIITPDGVIKSGKKKISLGGIEVKKYGFSQAVWQLCPQGWKKPLGDDWEDVLSIILWKWSPETLLEKTGVEISLC